MEDGQLDEWLDKDFNWELEVGKRKKRWKSKEEEMRQEKKNGRMVEQEEGPSLQAR